MSTTPDSADEAGSSADRSQQSPPEGQPHLNAPLATIRPPAPSIAHPGSSSNPPPAAREDANREPRAERGHSFSKEIYVAPFGRYEIGMPTEGPANAILVGRERERARVVDWLLSVARSGALLVTGHRGVGKSRFVEFCMREFEEDVYKRYLRSTIGRTWFWDFWLVLAVVFVALLLPLLASAVLEIIASYRTPHEPQLTTALGLLVTWPLSMLCAFPFVYALGTLNAAGDVLPTKGSWPRAVYAWICAGGCLAAALVGPFREPAVGAAFCVCLGAWLYAVVRALSVVPEVWPMHLSPGEASVSSFDTLSKWTRYSVPCAFVLGALLLTIVRPTEDSATDRAFDYLWASVPFFWIGLGLRAVDSRSLAAFLREAQRSDRFVQALAQTSRAKRASERGSNYRIAFLLMTLVVVVRLFSSAWRTPTFVVAFGVALALTIVAAISRGVLSTSGASRWSLQRPRAMRLLPRGRYAVALKGLFCLLLSVQCLMPVSIWLLAHLYAPLKIDAGSVDWFRGLLPDSSLLRAVLVGLSGNVLDPEGVRKHLQLGLWETTGVELCWLFIASIFALQIFSLEYSWIVRRTERERLDAALNPERTRDTTQPSPNSPDRATRVNNARELADATLFWLLFQSWLPVLHIRVNLGSDSFSHTRVIEAMLAGLRDRYYRTFISLRSRIGFGAFSLQVVSALLITAFVSLALPSQRDLLPQRWRKYDLEFYMLDERTSDHLVEYVWRYFHDGHAARQIVGFAVHHVIIFAIALTLLRLFSRRTGFYNAMNRRMRSLQEYLSSSVKTSGAALQPVLETLGVKLSPTGEKREVTSAPQDPRAIELAFQQLLNHIVEPYIRLPVRRHMISLPAPEIVFVFDELDKIGGRSVLATVPGAPELTLEGARTQQLHALFADVKSLLSTTPARFIFVGGRNLHDEWLADQTLLRPLLSSVFDMEVYLPTLLSDPIPVGAEERDPSLGTQAFVNAQLARASNLHIRWQKDKRMIQRFDPPRSPTLLFVQEPQVAEFKQGRVVTVDENAEHHTLTTLPIIRAGQQRALLAPWSQELIDCWVQYLAFRSRGIPRALHELLEGFVRPLGRVVDHEEDRATYFDCQHALYFGDVDRYRIQFVAALYRQLCGRSGEDVLSRRASSERLRRRRDESVQTTFYFADVLFKFHSRAFSWSNLERIDELSHVHAPAGIRRLLEGVVSAFSETHIMSTTSGIYDFRFRSETVAEIRYVSRQSPKEMAAFNFTLDESQALRQHYLQRLPGTDAGSHARYELEAAVGELYDFDERYEQARGHYERAISTLDVQLGVLHGAADKKAILAHVLDGASGRTVMRRHLQWGVARLRLMLRLGLTHERTRNYELAIVEYRDARTLSRALWTSILDRRGRNERKLAQGELEERGHRLETLKMLPILYQALFATAWLSEKAENAFEGSSTILEDGLWDLRQRLPAVRDALSPSLQRGVPLAHPAFFVLMADLHQATAQLYFYRSRDGGPVQLGTATPLDSAQYHYLVSLHELRHAMNHGVTDVAPATADEPDLFVLSWPDSLVRRAAATLFGLAEVWMARVQLEQIVDPRPAVLTTQRFRDWARNVHGSVKWFGTWNPRTEDGEHLDTESLPSGTKPASYSPHANLRHELVIGGHPAFDELVYAYAEAHGIAVSLLEHANHRREAARESIRCAAALENMLACLRALEALRSNRDSDGSKDNGAPIPARLKLQTWLVKQGTDALDRADAMLLEKVGRAHDFGSADFDRVFPHARTLAATLGLHATNIRERAESTATDIDEPLARLCELVDRWKPYKWNVRLVDARGVAVSKKASAAVVRDEFRAALRAGLSWQVYPMLNRLTALRSLVIDAALHPWPEQSTDCQEHAVELVRLDAMYASPWHFTPFHSGTAIGLWSVYSQQDNDEMAARALSLLRSSISSICGGAAHVDRLKDMFFLEGDFSDRCMHNRHSQQVLGGALTLELIKRLEQKGELRESHNGRFRTSRPAPAPPDGSSAPPSRPGVEGPGADTTA